MRLACNMQPQTCRYPHYNKLGDSPVICGLSLEAELAAGARGEVAEVSKRIASACHSMCDSRPRALILNVTASV